MVSTQKRLLVVSTQKRLLVVSTYERPINGLYVTVLTQKRPRPRWAGGTRFKKR